MSNKQWNIKLNGEGLSAQSIIFNIMSNRGISDMDSFLCPKESDFLPYTELKNIDVAKNVIVDTINKSGKFLIYADVDLDGCCSAAIAYRYLKNYTDNIKTYINKDKDHGVQQDFDFSIISDVDTIIIVDSINDTSEMYDKIIAGGKNVIIIDHHVPNNSILEKNYCLVSSAVDYKNPHLSGSGTTWKVMKYIDTITGNNYADNLVDLAASGIIGDVCNVGMDSPENRYICYIGLNNLVNPALKRIVGNYEFNSTSVSYSIAPLINAANRTGHNEEALEFFLTDDTIELVKLHDRLTSYKEYQKEEINRLYETLIIPQSQSQINNKCMYFMNDGESTFNGVVAGKAADDFGRPVMVLSKSKDGKLFSGSMRAVGIDDFRGLVDACEFASCMGHESSAGVSIDADNFFVVYNYIEESLKDYSFVQRVDVDVRLTPQQITENLIDQIKKINKISGQGFKPINVCIDEVTDYSITQMSGGKHLNVKCANNLSLIKWNISENDLSSVVPDRSISVVGTLDLNEFRGRVTRQLIISDYKIN